jgi:hypothetical protein
LTTALNMLTDNFDDPSYPDNLDNLDNLDDLDDPDDPDGPDLKTGDLGRGKRKKRRTERGKRVGECSGIVYPVVLSSRVIDQTEQKRRERRAKKGVSTAIASTIASQPPLANDTDDFVYGPAEEFVAPTFTGGMRRVLMLVAFFVYPEFIFRWPTR